MALVLLQGGYNPLGQFDADDTVATTFKGGEVVSFKYVDVPGTDLSAVDADGYANPGKRPVVTNQLTTGMAPLFLVDEGTTGYGTQFGSVWGGTAGQKTQGAELGPHTTTGSGKATLWDKPGLYAVTLDAVAADLAPTNAALTGGQKLYATATGKLTAVAADSFAGSGKCVVARFLEFRAKDSKVSTPASMTGKAVKLDRVVISFHPEMDN